MGLASNSASNISPLVGNKPTLYNSYLDSMDFNFALYNVLSPCVIFLDWRLDCGCCCEGDERIC